MDKQLTNINIPHLKVYELIENKTRVGYEVVPYHNYEIAHLDYVYNDKQELTLIKRSFTSTSITLAADYDFNKIIKVRDKDKGEYDGVGANVIYAVKVVKR